MFIQLTGIGNTDPTLVNADNIAKIENVNGKSRISYNTSGPSGGLISEQFEEDINTIYQRLKAINAIK